MSNQRLLTSQDGKSKPIDSSAEEIDFLGVRIGANNLPITQLDSTTIQIGAKLRTVAGTDADDSATKGQLDAEIARATAAEGALSDDIDAEETARIAADDAEEAARIAADDAQVAATEALEGRADVLEADVLVLQNQVAAILANNPIERTVVVGAGGTSIITAPAGISWDADNEVFDIEVYVNGDRWTQNPDGLLDTHDFRKNSTTELESASPIPENAKVVIWKQGTAVATSGGTSTLVKTMQNLSGVSIAAGRPVSKKADGSIIAADSDGADTQIFIGISLQSIADNATGQIALVGQNIANAVATLGFAPGDEIFLSEVGGYTNDPDSLTGNDDSIIRIGIADCSAGAASATANDLIMFPEVILRP